MECIFKATEQWEMTNEWLTSGDIKKRTILHFAAIYGYLGVATFIVDKIIQATKDTDLTKEYLNMTDHKGRTPYHLMCIARCSVETNAFLKVASTYNYLLFDLRRQDYNRETPQDLARKKKVNEGRRR